MSHIPAAMRRIVLRRAGWRCEYCRLAQQGQAGTFHVDHIVPRAAGGPTQLENLAFACIACSLRKGSRRVAVDPVSEQIVTLYHPRRDAWPDHFRWRGLFLEGQTPIGRATVAALQMNHRLQLDVRGRQTSLGLHPPPETTE